MDEKFYKVLGSNGEAMNGGTGTWFLPARGKPGKWMPKIKGDLVPCENGYHLCRENDLLHWLGPTIYEAEYRGDHVDADDKIVVREARLLRRMETWNDRTARLFACDCAEWALSLIKNPDARSVEAVRVARLYAIGETGEKELAAACSATRDAGAAACSAARDAWAAWAATCSAARDAWAAWAACAANWDAWAAGAAGAAWNAAEDKMTGWLFGYLDGNKGQDGE